MLRDLSKDSGVTVFISSHILSEIARLATRIGVVHEGRLVKELDAAELLKQEERRLTVDVRDVAAGLKALARAGITASPDGNNTLSISDRQAMQHPENIATLLVEAGSPPTRLVIERGDLESYFLKLVGLEKGNSDEQRR
jgi:ABC-2 type transport system ATP-binding protein